MELVNNQTLFPDPAEEAPCERCGNTGKVKIYTQEWDMIKSHTAPCPMCFSQEWLDWSAGKRLVEKE